MINQAVYKLAASTVELQSCYDCFSSLTEQNETAIRNARFNLLFHGTHASFHDPNSVEVQRKINNLNKKNITGINKITEKISEIIRQTNELDLMVSDFSNDHILGPNTKRDLVKFVNELQSKLKDLPQNLKHIKAQEESSLRPNPELLEKIDLALLKCMELNVAVIKVENLKSFDEQIRSFVCTFLHPAISGQITKSQAKFTPQMMPELKKFLGLKFKENVKTFIIETAIRAYIDVSVKGLYSYCYEQMDVKYQGYEVAGILGEYQKLFLDPSVDKNLIQNECHNIITNRLNPYNFILDEDRVGRFLSEIKKRMKFDIPALKTYPEEKLNSLFRTAINKIASERETEILKSQAVREKFVGWS